MLIVSTCSMFAQTATYKSGSVFWKISGKDLSKPSYLLGTLHFKPAEYLDSIPGARAALQSCEQAVGEILLSDMAGLQNQMMQAMMMPADTTYKMLYSDDDYRFVSEKIASLTGGAGLEQFGRLKPAAIQLTVSVIAYMKYFPEINMSNTIDIYIQKEATNSQKPVLGLETIDDQIHAIFGILNLKQQADALLCSMKNSDKMIAFVPEVLNDYNAGDLNKLAQRFEENEICPSTAAETDALNKNRNEAWLKKLPEIMKNKSSFIAVGAIHLAGEDGLLNQLEKAGYKVEAVNF